MRNVITALLLACIFGGASIGASFYAGRSRKRNRWT